MRLRKQAKTGPLPGDEFLRAVSSGRGEAPPQAPPAQRTDAGLRQQLLETERRATAAEDALRQIRDESRQRLEEARSALERERNARLAAEKELELAREGQVERQDEPATAAPAEPAAEEEPLAFHEPDQRPRADSAGDDEEQAEWPTPWLGSGDRRRGIFRRSSS